MYIPTHACPPIRGTDARACALQRKSPPCTPWEWLRIITKYPARFSSIYGYIMGIRGERPGPAMPRTPCVRYTSSMTQPFASARARAHTPLESPCFANTQPRQARHSLEQEAVRIRWTPVYASSSPSQAQITGIARWPWLSHFDAPTCEVDATQRALRTIRPWGRWGVPTGDSWARLGHGVISRDTGGCSKRAHRSHLCCIYIIRRLRSRAMRTTYTVSRAHGILHRSTLQPMQLSAR